MQSTERLDSDDDVLTFKTPRRTRIKSILYSFTMGACCFPLAFFFAFLVYLFANVWAHLGQPLPGWHSFFGCSRQG